MRPANCKGVGLALPTLVDVRIGKITVDMIGKYEGLAATDLNAWAKSEFNLPMKIENDAHAAILGEWRFGAGRGSNDLVMATFGTGIGTSVIIGARPLRGRHASAGNLGAHFVVEPNGFPCVCGSRGCLEAQQHRKAVESIARADARFVTSALSKEASIDYAAIFRLASTDALAHDLLNRSIGLWSALVVTLTHQFDCTRFIVGGGIMRSADVILPSIRVALDHACTPWGKVELVTAALGDDAALHGLTVCIEEQLEYL
jgi:glucokinase